MSTSITVVCYKSKKLSNGNSPLMLRITKDRKLKYLSLGISIETHFLDFERNKPKANCPNKDLINKVILPLSGRKIIELSSYKGMAIFIPSLIY